MIVIDTNVLSELLKREPDQNVKSWMSLQPMTSVFTTTVTQAEILYGVALLPEGKRKRKLKEAIQTLFFRRFTDRILPFDIEAAVEYAEIASSRRASGVPISQFDAQIAAISRTRGASLVTRNSDDFRDCGIEVINPWIV